MALSVPRPGKKTVSAAVVSKPLLASTPARFGAALKAERKRNKATLATAAGLSDVGIRFLLELEHGKPTCELGKAMQVAERLGLELWLVPRGQRPDGFVP